MIDISNDIKQNHIQLLNERKETELEIIKERLSLSFEQIKDQFEDHLETINENTTEIQSNFEYICDLDRKIDKLGERIDQLTNLIREDKGESIEKKTFTIQPLTKKEKEVFYALYVLTEHRKYATYKDISRRARFSENLVASYLINLIEKGIPVVKKYANRTAYLSLNPEFRELQTKENIVGVNTLLTHWTNQ